MGRRKSLGSLKSCASPFSGACILCFSHPEFFSAHYSVAAARRLPNYAGILLLLECP